MKDLLSTEEATAAAAQGWALEHVFDLEKDKWIVSVTGSPDAHAASQKVYTLAKKGNPLAIKALRIVMNGMKK